MMPEMEVKAVDMTWQAMANTTQEAIFDRILYASWWGGAQLCSPSSESGATKGAQSLSAEMEKGKVSSRTWTSSAQARVMKCGQRRFTRAKLSN